MLQAAGDESARPLGYVNACQAQFFLALLHYRGGAETVASEVYAHVDAAFGVRELHHSCSAAAHRHNIHDRLCRRLFYQVVLQ